MKTKKCKLIEYRNTYYLIFDEIIPLRKDTRVLTAFHHPVARIVGFANEFDREGFYYVSNGGGMACLYGKALDVIAATASEISESDLEILKEKKDCAVELNSWEPVMKNGKVVIQFQT